MDNEESSKKDLERKSEGQNSSSEGQAQTASTEINTEPQINIIGERKAIVYAMDSMRRQREELSDSFYDLTASDLKLILRDLRRVADGDESDVPLLTKEQRELERNKRMLNKMVLYKNCIIRIQFPDRYVLQGVFLPSDTIRHIVDFVRSFLLESERKFSLFTTPPKKILEPNKNLLELDLVPTAVVHFMWDDQPEFRGSENLSILRPDILKELTSIEGADFAAKSFRLFQRRKSNEAKYVDDGELPGPSNSKK